MNRAKVKLGLSEKSVSEKLLDADRIIANMSASAVFGGVVDLTDIIAKRDALLAARTARNAAQSEAKSKTEALATAGLAFNDSLKDLATEAETVSGYDAEALEGGGFETFIPGVSNPVSSIGTPVILDVSPGGSSGKINVDWLPVEEASHGYNLYISTNPNQEDDFQFVKSVSRSSAVLTGLNTGTKYWIQVVAKSATVQSEPSDPASSVAR